MCVHEKVILICNVSFITRIYEAEFPFQWVQQINLSIKVTFSSFYYLNIFLSDSLLRQTDRRKSKQNSTERHSSNNSPAAIEEEPTSLISDQQNTDPVVHTNTAQQLQPMFQLKSKLDDSPTVVFSGYLHKKREYSSSIRLCTIILVNKFTESRFIFNRNR